MTKLSQLGILLLIICLPGCFLLFPSSSGSSSSASSTSSTSDLLIKRWTLQQVYFVANQRTYDRRSVSSSWMQFYSNNTCNQYGIVSNNAQQSLRWSVSGNKLTLSGSNLSYGDGNLSSSSVTYTIVSITNSELHLSRQDGFDSNGASRTRHLVFTTNTTTVQTQSKTVAQLLVSKRWKGLQTFDISEGVMDNNRDLPAWIQFYESGICYENGLFGTQGRRQLRWTVNGNQLTISGNGLDIDFEDGNLSAPQLTYTIVSITDKELHISRLGGGYKLNGAEYIRHFRFN